MIIISLNFLFWLCIAVLLCCATFKDQVFHLTRR